MPEIIIAPPFIVKRDGSAAPFDPSKIRAAMHKANIATPDEQISPQGLDELTSSVVSMIGSGKIPDVEQVQDMVEEALIKAGYAKTAKAYILYRAEHTMQRHAQADLMDIYKELTFAYAKDADIKRENANIDADTAMGTMLKYGSEGAKYFVDNFVLPRDIATAHINGDIHIHDKDFYMLTETCCQIDIIKLFENGFSTGHGYLREPNSIQSYAALCCIAIQANQNEMHGGQSVPNFDYAMALGVKKTFRKEYTRAFAKYAAVLLSKPFAEGDAAAKEVLRSITCGIEMQNEKNMRRHIGKYKGSIGREDALRIHELAFETAVAETDRATFQAMEAFVHNLNTMNSRAGAQVPFSSVNYGTDISPEGRMVIKNLLLATDAGLGNGETPIFPVQIFKVKEGVNYFEKDPNYDLFLQAVKTSAKRLFPNFSFLDAPFNLQYYKPGDYNSEVAYMGCRTRVMANVADRGREVTCGRGNLSFTSVNLPRIAIEAKGDIEAFYSLLDARIDIVIRQLLHRLRIQSGKKCLNYPFLMGQGIWLDSETLAPDDLIGDVLKHGTLTMGFIGLAETLKALIGEHHGESERAQKLGVEIVSHMRARMDEQSERSELNFTLIATPAEGLSGRFVHIDKKVYGEIEGVTDRDYYTNSFHVPVYYDILAHKKIQIEAPYHALTNAGHISYVELDGDTSKNQEAFMAIIKCMKESGIGYGSVNHPVDRDPVCGYTGVIDEFCPRCGRRDGEEVSIEKLNELRKKYPGMPVNYGIK